MVREIPFAYGTMKNIIYADYVVLIETDSGLFREAGYVSFPNTEDCCWFGKTRMWDGQEFLNMSRYVAPDGCVSYAVQDTPENMERLKRCEVEPRMYRMF